MASAPRPAKWGPWLWHADWLAGRRRAASRVAGVLDHFHIKPGKQDTLSLHSLMWHPSRIDALPPPLTSNLENTLSPASDDSRWSSGEQAPGGT